MKKMTLLALLSVSAACGTPPGSAPELGLPPSWGEAASATYGSLLDLEQPVTLQNGRWEHPDRELRTTVTLAPGFLETADFNGDGAPEAVVALSQQSGGSGTINYLAVIARADTGPRVIATKALGDRVALRDIAFEGDRMRISVVRAGPDDAMCCPGELADLHWRVVGGEIQESAPPVVTDRLSLSVLHGTTWSLRTWTFDEAVPVEAGVTIRWEDGRVSGSSGCNNYTASATAGDVPGNVTITTPAGTRMACPPPASDVEARYLSQLAGVTKFSFILGELALTYQRDGVFGVMRFTPVIEPR